MQTGWFSGWYTRGWSGAFRVLFKNKVWKNQVLLPFPSCLTPSPSSPPAPQFPHSNLCHPSIPTAECCMLAVGGMCRAAGSQSSTASLDCIPQTPFPSRALIPGLGPPLAAFYTNDYFPLINYPRHRGVDILHWSPAWSLIMGAWGMIVPHRHPSIAVSKSQEGRQTIAGTCPTEVLLFLGQEAAAEEEESSEGGWGGPVTADAGWGSAAEALAQDGQSWERKKRGGKGTKWGELRGRQESRDSPVISGAWGMREEGFGWTCGPSRWSSSGFQLFW